MLNVKMKPFLVALLAWLPNILCDPTIEDNKVPTDEEVLKDLLSRQGQPEEEASLGLPTDEESFNELRAFLLGPISGTHHFVAASFPEIDARGFHESVFNGPGDYFASWPRKRTISDDNYVEHVTNEDLGIFHPFRDWGDLRQAKYDTLAARRVHSGLSRGKRQLPSLVQSCSLPGITCDPITQSGEDTAETSTPTSLTTSQESQTGANSTSVETTTAPLPTELMLPISTRYLVKRSATSKSGTQHALADQNGKQQIEAKLRRLFERSMKDRTNRVMMGELISSKLLTQLRAKGHLKRFFKKRRPEMTSTGFHTDTFHGGFGDFDIMKRKPEMSSSGFHGDTFSGGFGDFDTVKRRPEMSSSGFHGDTFTGGFGEFDTVKRRPEMSSSGFHGDTFSRGFGDFDIMKRKPEMSSSGFHGDTFTGGFGEFDTVKRRPEMSSSGFHGDTFTGGFGEFDTVKRRPEMSSSGFHGDTFTGGFGEFDTVKRRPEMSSSGFHGDTFTGGFGEFDTVKRRPEMSSSGFHGDTFTGGFGEFDTVKRRPEMSSSGFHGDTFTGGFGEFDTVKRRPEMSSSGFHGDTFNGGFGDFDIMKREANPSGLRGVKRYKQDKNAHRSDKDHNNDSHKTVNSHLQPSSHSSTEKLTKQS